MRQLVPIILAALFAAGLLAGCSAQSPEQDARQTELRETQMDVYVQQTLLAQQMSAQQTTEALETLAGPPATLPPTPPAAPETVAVPPTPAPATSEPPTAGPPTEPPSPTPVPGPSFDEWKQSAQILLYEDMVARLDTIRYVKNTLDDIGLPYKDDGSAKGWLRTDIENGAPGGKPWDLVIIAAEDKDQPENELFDHVMTSLERGSSVILETWYLSQTFGERAAPILEACGVAYEGDYRKIPPSRMVLFALDSANPLLNQPNQGLTFSNTVSYWWDSTGQRSYDVGDLLQKGSGGGAELVLGTQASDTAGHATLARCMDGRLILQTFSSHNINYDVMKQLWENYIDHALRARYQQVFQAAP